MLSDRISLVLAYNYLQGAENTYQNVKVSDMKFSYQNAYLDSTGIQFVSTSLSELVKKIESLAPVMSVPQAECENMGVYELRSFNITWADGSYAYIENVNGWRTTAAKINNMTIMDLDEYQGIYNDLLALYLQVYNKEYIKEQNSYVDCHYIQRLFGPIIDKIKVLYEKYKTV
jgi:hypothetical protein